MARKKLAAKKPAAKKPAAKKPAAPSPFDDTARLARVTACQSAIEAVLKRHNCRLEGEVIIRGGRVRSLVVVLANDPAGPPP